MNPTNCAERSTSAVSHRRLASFNRTRLQPGLPGSSWRDGLIAEMQARVLECEFLEHARQAISALADSAPTQDPEAFIAWFEQLRQTGPGQQDPLFTFLSEQATVEQMRWFIAQEVAGEAGFDDLVALAQLKMPTQAKLEMARNYWDEMGRGVALNMHSHLLERVVEALHCTSLQATILPAPLALSNVMMGLACNRSYAYHAIGALGAIELTAPDRVAAIASGLRRLGFSAAECRYYELHAVLDPQHAKAWNREVLTSLVRGQPGTAHAIAEGALMRLQAGAECFVCYREHLMPGFVACDGGLEAMGRALR